MNCSAWRGGRGGKAWLRAGICKRFKELNRPTVLTLLAWYAQRKAWAALVEGVAAGGGEALVFSAAHVSGEQLNQLSGVAAVLRFPLPELEDAELDAE